MVQANTTAHDWIYLIVNPIQIPFSGRGGVGLEPEPENPQSDSYFVKPAKPETRKPWPEIASPP